MAFCFCLSHLSGEMEPHKVAMGPTLRAQGGTPLGQPLVGDWLGQRPTGFAQEILKKLYQGARAKYEQT